jgi:acyl-CoA thioester hydrolase
MPVSKFAHPMEVRYGDLDPQGHLNNAKYLTYFEQARVQYFSLLGLFSKHQSFMDIGVIIADIHIQYRAPLLWGASVKVGVRTAKIGSKSLTLEQSVVDDATDQVYATGTVILVAYDYHTHQTIPVPRTWREKLTDFEGL